jgi:hypothetical protein
MRREQGTNTNGQVITQKPYQFAKSTAFIGRQSWSNPSPAIDSPKREYSRKRPETFGDFRLKFGRAGVRRPKRMREKPGFPAHSRVSWEARQTHAFLLELVSGRHWPDLGISHNCNASMSA